MQVDILAVGVHPDDIELGCGGTLLQHIAQGYTVSLLDLTWGELGSRGSATLRRQEALKAAELLGAKNRYQLDLADGFFRNTPENMLKIVEVIRLCRPKIVLCNAINDRHPDHARAAQLVADACFYSGLVKIETQYQGETQTAHRPAQVYHYIQDYQLEPDFVLDISPVMGKKMELILAFGSQFFNENDNPNEPKTPISGQDFLESVKAKARVYGRPAGFEFAEGFNSARYVGVKNLFDLC